MRPACVILIVAFDEWNVKTGVFSLHILDAPRTTLEVNDHALVKLLVQFTGDKLVRQLANRARAGTKRTPTRRGGGHAFGKKPIDYYYRLPRKALQKAMRMALLSKFQDDEAVVLSELTLNEVKTKPVATMLKSLGLANDSTLLVVPEYNKTAYLSARNVENLQIMPASDLNAYVLLRQKRLLITKDSIDAIRNNTHAQQAEPAAAN